MDEHQLREIENWLVTDGARCSEPTGLLEGYCVRLGEAGIPVDRSTLGAPRNNAFGTIRKPRDRMFDHPAAAGWGRPVATRDRRGLDAQSARVEREDGVVPDALQRVLEAQRVRFGVAAGGDVGEESCRHR